MVITEELIFNGKESRLDDRFEERRKGGEIKFHICSSIRVYVL